MSTCEMRGFGPSNERGGDRGTARREGPWFTAGELARLLGTTRPVIARHLEALFASHELDRAQAVRDVVSVGQEGWSGAYSLEALLALGWRAGSARGMAFRRWASEMLSQVLLDGFAVHEEALRRQGRALRVVPCAPEPLADRGIGDVARAYGQAFSALGGAPRPRGNPCIHRLEYAECQHLVAELKRLTPEERFGRERGDVLERGFAALGDHSEEGQTISAEEHAARVLHLVLARRPFVDGNKRIAGCLFLYVLDRNYLLFDGSMLLVSPGALAALVLLLTASPERDAEEAVTLVMNVIACDWREAA